MGRLQTREDTDAGAPTPELTKNEVDGGRGGGARVPFGYAALNAVIWSHKKRFRPHHPTKLAKVFAELLQGNVDSEIPNPALGRGGLARGKGGCVIMIRIGRT